MEQFEENKPIGPFWGWAMVCLLTGAIIGWCMFLMMMLDDPARQWDFGALPDVPAQSVYSTSKSPRVHFTFPLLLRTRPSVTKDVPPQMSPLPEGIPWKPPTDANAAAPSAAARAGVAP